MTWRPPFVSVTLHEVWQTSGHQTSRVSSLRCRRVRFEVVRDRYRNDQLAPGLAGMSCRSWHRTVMLVQVSSPGGVMDQSTTAGRLLAVSLAGAALLLAGCSTGNASAGPAISRTVTASPSGLASQSATPSTSAGPASCKAGTLSVVLGHARAARGSTLYPIAF